MDPVRQNLGLNNPKRLRKSWNVFASRGYSRPGFGAPMEQPRVALPDNRYLLRQVLAADHLDPGTFFVNISNQVLEVWDPGNRVLAQLQEPIPVHADEVLKGGVSETCFALCPFCIAGYGHSTFTASERFALTTMRKSA